MSNRYLNQKGQSLLELLIAITVFVIVISGIMLLTLTAHITDRQGTERAAATLLAQEGLEAALSIKNKGWKNLTLGDHGLTNVKNIWEFSDSSDQVDKYTRRISVEAGQRDSNGDLVYDGGTVDFDTKKVVSRVNWEFQPGRASEVVIESYLTNWRSVKWLQTTQADFNLGTLMNTEVSGDQVQLARQSGQKVFDWTFDNELEYQYDPAKIKISNSQAQLVGSNTVIYSGQTSNPGFNNNLNSWNYLVWDRQSGEPNFVGAQISSGGNPGGWARVRFVGTASQSYQDGGFFQQQFSVNRDGVTQASLHLDWMVQQIYGVTQPRARLYAFLSTSAGEPVRDSADQVWASDWLTVVSPWTSVDIPVASKLQTPGNYYLKIGVWVEGSTGLNAINIGFDNSWVTWQITEERYPTDGPTIQPTKSFVADDLQQWQFFEEQAKKNGGEIYYQLSDDNGATWQYWNGNRWRQIRNARDYNTATVVNSQLRLFSTSNRRLMFRAFLSSDGTQLISLDNIRVGYLASDGGRYYASGNFVSVAYDTGASAPLYNYLDWTAFVPTSTSLRFQIRTAATQADLASAPWAGPDGTATSFFTEPGQTIFGEAGQRWVQYQVLFGTTDGAITPILHDITIDYEL